MKLNPLLCSFAVCSLAACATLLPPLASAAPAAHPGHHKSTAARPSYLLRQPKPKARAFILNGAAPGTDPNRMDHMAIGSKMHPERMDHMNVAPPVRRAPVTPK